MEILPNTTYVHKRIIKKKKLGKILVHLVTNNNMHQLFIKKKKKRKENVSITLFPRLQNFFFFFFAGFVDRL